jgi:hypothetical protein
MELDQTDKARALGAGWETVTDKADADKDVDSDLVAVRDAEWGAGADWVAA